jgi:hypothetical protein
VRLFNSHITFSSKVVLPVFDFATKATLAGNIFEPQPSPQTIDNCQWFAELTSKVELASNINNNITLVCSARC